MSRGLFTMKQVAAAGLRRNDPAAHAQQVRDGYIAGVEGSRPAVISVNMFAASLAVNELLARLHPFREEDNANYGVGIFSLASMELMPEPEDGRCEILVRHVAQATSDPCLDKPSYPKGAPDEVGCQPLSVGLRARLWVAPPALQDPVRRGSASMAT